MILRFIIKFLLQSIKLSAIAVTIFVLVGYITLTSDISRNNAYHRQDTIRRFNQYHSELRNRGVMNLSDGIRTPLSEVSPGTFDFLVNTDGVNLMVLKNITETDRIIYSCDTDSNAFIIGLNDWRNFQKSREDIPILEKHLETIIKNERDKGFFPKYIDDKFVFFIMSCLDLRDWETLQENGKKQLRPYWNTTRAQQIYNALPRNDTDVHVILFSGAAAAEGTGSSIRSAVASALPGDSPFPSMDITHLAVTTHGAYRLHEVNADVFSDDLAFIRTALTNLEHLNLSKTRFYNDTVPVSAFDCSTNIEYAFNLPKGYLPRLTRIDLPPSVVSVDWYAFRNLRALRSMYLPNTRCIAGQAFEGCLSLDAVYIPSVESIGQGSFFKCKSLESVVVPQLKRTDPGAFLFSGVHYAGVPYTASMDTGTFSLWYFAGEADTPPPLQGLLVLNCGKETGSSFKFHQSRSIDVFCNTPLDLSNDFPPGSRQSGYVLPPLQPQWPEKEIHLKAGESAELPVRFRDPSVSPGWIWGLSENPRVVTFEAGTLKAAAPGKTTVTVTGMTAAVTLQGAMRECTFSNWPVPLHEPVRINVTVQAQEDVSPHTDDTRGSREPLKKGCSTSADGGLLLWLLVPVVTLQKGKMRRKAACGGNTMTHRANPSIFIGNVCRKR